MKLIKKSIINYTFMLIFRLKAGVAFQPTVTFEYFV